jgi:curved DNA-binding protein CbpA
MSSGGGASDRPERIPRLASDWDPTSHALSPVEGFLLSRIDGRTSWTQLRQIGAIAPEDVDRILERWVKEGWLLLGPCELAASESPGGERAARPSASDIDPGLELPVELQRRILEFDGALNGSTYFDVLGVERSADARAIKLAYFRLSKEFHPDRYFRRRIGAYATRLERIFKVIVEAYELLSDPATRGEIERAMPHEAGPAEGAYRVENAPADRIAPERRPRGYRKPTPMENLERLRRSFRMPKKILAERQFKARQFYQAAQVSAHGGSWLEAAASARLAIAFDPWNREYKEAFASIQAEVHRVRAAELLERASTEDAKSEALRMVEEAISYRPGDPEAHALAARLALELGEVERALEAAETAAEIEPEVAAHHAVLARALRRLGRNAEAVRALQRAEKLDARHPEVRAERSHLGRR